MKNVIMIVLDSFSFFEYEFAKKKNIMPFLAELEKKSIFASKVYSEGPHTEVGVRGLIGGCNTLDNGGSYRHFMNVKETVFDIFLRENYQVNYIAHPAMYLPERVRTHNLFCHYYTSAYKFLYLWRNRLDYWANIYSQRELNTREKEAAINICRDAFDITLDFWASINDRKEKIALINKRFDNVDAKRVVKEIHSEKNKFEENPWKYVRLLFVDFDNNILTQITDIDESKGEDEEFLAYIKKKHRKLLRRLKLKQKLSNILVDSHTAKDIMLGVKDKILTGRSDNLKSYDEWHRRLVAAKEFDLEYLQAKQGLAPSLEKELSLALEILTNNSAVNKTHSFIYMQPAELHFHNNWFSHDIIDEYKVDGELKTISKIFGSRLINEKGYLTQSLALCYVDCCLRKFFDELKTRGFLDNTLVVITSDHGSSYGHAPIRNGLPSNNFFSENYHIPLFFYDQGRTGSIDNLLLNCDVVPTLMDMLGMNGSIRHMKGRSAFATKREIVHTEYLGPGYQDLLGRDIWFSARNSNYKINYIVGLYEDFKSGTLEGVYNITGDPQELNNLVNKNYDHEEVGKLMKYLEERRKQIQKEQKQ